MGYSYLQFSGGTYDPDVIARVSKESGLPFVLTHVPIERIIGDTDALMEEHAHFGCKNIGLGAMTGSIIADADTYKAKIEELDAAGEKMEKNGFKFFYHHHHYEFIKHDGETVFDYILKTIKILLIALNMCIKQFAFCIYICSRKMHFNNPVKIKL